MLKLQHIHSSASEELSILVCSNFFWLIFTLKSNSKRNEQNNMLRYYSTNDITH